MPITIFEGGKLSKGQKAELVKGLTEVVSRVTMHRVEAFTVLIREDERENVGVGGQLLSERRKG